MEHRDFSALRQWIAELYDLRATGALLDWDQQVDFPPGAEFNRCCQLETLAGVIHAKATSPKIGRWLAKLEGFEADPDSFEAAFLAKVRRAYQKDTRTPAKLASALARAAADSHGAWLRAREADDFSLLAPNLERIVALKREYAALFPEADSCYDPLLDDYEPGMTEAELRRIFAELLPVQREIVREATANSAEPESFGEFPETAQLNFSREVVRRLGYDFRRGRLDLTEHPFTTNIGLGDVRITTAIDRRQPVSCLLSAVHECGHALYEQGIEPAFDRTPLADGASYGFHESQSRLYENQLARGTAFWRYFYPKFQKRFPRQLGAVPLERFLASINRVEPSLIRTEADEATYNLHIILRFELESALLAGRISVAELPELWRSRMHELLGVTPSGDRDGVLQDIHWPLGLFGYFPSYALGNLIAAQIWKCIAARNPVESELAAGKFGGVLDFLREHVHRYGAKYYPSELLRRITGDSRISPEPYLDYLQDKYLYKSTLY